MTLYTMVITKLRQMAIQVRIKPVFFHSLLFSELLGKNCEAPTVYLLLVSCAELCSLAESEQFLRNEALNMRKLEEPLL